MIEQNNIFSWYRAADKKNPFGIWKPVSLENTTFRITLRNTENGKIFCPLHCIWEDYERHNEFEIECSGKKTFNGLIIPWIPQKKKPEPKNRGVLVINKILQNQQEYNYNYNSRLYNSCDSDDTDFEKDQIQAVDAIRSENLQSAQPLGLCKSEEVANLVVFLLSDAVKTMTGTAIVLDGGYTL